MGKTFEEGKKYAFYRLEQVTRQVVAFEPVIVAQGDVEKTFEDAVILKDGTRLLRRAFDAAREVEEEKRA